MVPEKHCRLSPSSSKRWLACPFSAQVDLPQVVSKEDSTGGKACTTGQDIHQLAAEVISGRASLDDVPDDWKLGVHNYVAHVAGNDGDLIAEHFWESICIDDFGGTADVTLLKDNKACVYDFKTGKWPVEAAGNTQLLCYLSIIAEHHDVDEFYGVIVQPKTFKGDKIKVAEFSLEQIDLHRERVAEAAVSDYKSVGDHCRFCPLRLTDQCDEGRSFAKKKGWK